MSQEYGNFGEEPDFTFENILSNLDFDPTEEDKENLRQFLLNSPEILTRELKVTTNNYLSFLEEYQKSKSSPIIKFGEIKQLSFKQKMKKYCQLLYEYLKATKTCFVKGAFVIDDENGKLKDLLREGQKKSEKKNNIITLPNLLASHKDFGPDVNKESDICPSESGICEINLTNIDDVFDLYCTDEYKNDKYLKPKFESVRQLKKNIKFYFFNNNQSKAGKSRDRFVFFKLELDPTVSLAHLLLAFKRYKLGIDESLDTFPIRREDCRKDTKTGCKCNKTNNSCRHKFYTDHDGISIDNSDDCIVNYDLHNRIGDEYFINVHVNDEIVRMIQQNIPNDKFNIKSCQRKPKNISNSLSTAGNSGINVSNGEKYPTEQELRRRLYSREAMVGGSRKKHNYRVKKTIKNKTRTKNNKNKKLTKN
jgi:hypothetical protein